MHPLENHQPEYMNHIMMRFGHHLSVHQQQTVSSRFSGALSSSSQGSRIQKKFSSVTTQHRLPTNISSLIRPVVHMSKPSIPSQPKTSPSNTQKDDDDAKEEESEPPKQQCDVIMKDVSPTPTNNNTDQNPIVIATKNVPINDDVPDDKEEEQEDHPTINNDTQVNTTS
ncbi:hypothetical protein BDA99DRAFT_525065 [Phascolomyces articulosus]|uniref:Uncharacterized protein n=1 Tax=Phascolomyces articulosus TaxID=60185 RepID=A0AAD5JPL4_9FUNG|nr:hypothetical protein BDA99DRAFT_525065 [Phascolomyces articulosus]